MNYTVQAVCAVVLAVLVDVAVLRTSMVGRRAFWASYAIVLFFQLIVNGVLTGVPVVRYRSGSILGWRLAFAPVEDLLFGFAMVLLTLSGWVWFGRRQPRPDRARPPAAGD